MHALKLAFRNILRNKRRTLATVFAVMTSCAGLLLFAGYLTWAHQGGETHAVTQVGHLQLFKKGFYQRGAGNPSAFVIDGYARLNILLREDAILKDRLQLVTGQLLIMGLVSSAAQQTSTPFIGLGVSPEENQELIEWNPYRIYDPRRLKINREILQEGAELNANDDHGGSLGVGLAAILQISLQSNIAMTPKSIDPASAPPEQRPPLADEIAPGLTLAPLSASPAPLHEGPTVELLSMPPTGGTPNMVTLGVRKIMARATKEVDDRLLKMPIATASSLVFPGEEIKVTSVVLLLHKTGDLPLVLDRVSQLIAQHQLDLEIRTWRELVPDYQRTMEMFDMFFTFTLCVVGVILVFTIFNTIHMGVLERTGEIGTLRAIGMTRGGVMTGFLLEGFVLGLCGAVMGVVLGVVVAAAINRVEIVYQLPVVPYYTKLEVMVLQNPVMVVTSFVGCLLVAVIAAIPAARSASRMSIADALRH